MNDKNINRKITVIFATDVVNYSKHMEIDENQTIKNLRICEKILKGLFEKYEARLFNSGGDSFLSEFPSAVSAVECAVEFQNLIKKRNTSDDTDIKLEFRVGLNSGDVVIENENLLGDGVNIAARLESLSQPNGITISKSIYDYVKSKTKHEFHDLGIQKIKNNEFHAYDIILDPNQKRKLNKYKSKKYKLPLFSALLLILVLGVYGIYNIETKNNSLKDDTSLPLVLIEPFKTSNNDEISDDISFGLTESLITTLSNYNGIDIFSSKTSTHVGKNNYTDEFLREKYKVDYVVRGSIQTIGNSSRITVNLVDLKNDKIIWSDKNNFKIDNIFEAQDIIGINITKTLQVDATEGKIATDWLKEFVDFETYTYALNWRHEILKFTPDGYTNSEKYYELLKNNIPKNGIFYNISAWRIFWKIVNGFSEDFKKDITELNINIENAINLRGNHSDYALKAMNELIFLSRDCKIALADAEKALSLGTDSEIYTIAGSVNSGCGNLDKGINLNKKALRLTPNDNGWLITNNIVVDLYQLGRLQEISEIVDDNINKADLKESILGIYAIVLHKSGENDKAKELLEKAKTKGLTKDFINRWLGASKFVSENGLSASQMMLSDLKEIGKID